MKKIIFAATLLGVMLLGHIADAQQYRRHTPANQRGRINQGINQGSLTRTEARHLRYQQSKIQRMKRIARADGRITPIERHRIAKAERRANYAIYRQKHNPYRRY